MSLTSREAKIRLEKFGPNSIPEKKQSFLLKLVKWLISPITLMLLVAAVLSLIGHEIFDFYLILSLTVLNGVISFWQEAKASGAVEALKSKLRIQVKVKRDDKWQEIDSELLVPGDEVSIVVGSLIPADGTLTKVSNLTINDAALTGESLPKNAAVNDQILSGAFVLTGSGSFEVTRTGIKTTYGKSILLIEKSSKRSFLQHDILAISYLLSIASVIGIGILTVIFLVQHQPIASLLQLDLSLAIAGVPISLPTVMSIIISLGVLGLAKKNVIVRQMSALQNLANVNLLLTDKTGTLTQNSISVAKVYSYSKSYGENAILNIAAASATNDSGPIDQALHSSRQPGKEPTVKEIIPADSIRKRTTGYLVINNEEYVTSVGAPQIVSHLCRLTSKDEGGFNKDVEKTARDGYRTLAVSIAKGKDEKNMTLIGLICLADPLRPESASVISYLNKQGIDVKLLTGDNLAISKNVASQLGLHGETVSARVLTHTEEKTDKKWWDRHSGFAEVLPTDKYRLVEQAKKQYVVAVTGDGVNDLPAISVSDVGIAVSNAVDALKSGADIVIIRPGIEVIKDALIEARKIFERLYSYSVYRISESYRLILTIVILGGIVHLYPVTPIQLILLAFLNDLPIISLAVNRVHSANAPAKSNSRKKFYRGLLHGNVGVLSSISMFLLLFYVFHLPLTIIQTAFFLKFTVSGHMLIYVAHTDQPWYKFLPSGSVILATSITQIIATTIALVGLFMPAIPIWLVILIWIWSFGWMQISDLAKKLIPQK
jgi:H+-transporting ATPase